MDNDDKTGMHLQGSKIASTPATEAVRCSECGYVRQPTDTAPAWECPQCQVVYAKISAPVTVLPFQRKLTKKPTKQTPWKFLMISFFVSIIITFTWLHSKHVAYNTHGARGNVPVILYSATWCGYCHKAHNYLTENNIPFQEYDVELSEKGQSDYAMLHGSGIPLILVGDERMDGYSEQYLEHLLHNAGYRY